MVVCIVVCNSRTLSRIGMFRLSTSTSRGSLAVTQCTVCQVSTTRSVVFLTRLFVFGFVPSVVIVSPESYVNTLVLRFWRRIVLLHSFNGVKHETFHFGNSCSCPPGFFSRITTTTTTTTPSTKSLDRTGSFRKAIQIECVLR